MTFLTYDEYIAYNGVEIPADDFLRIAARACEAVDAATGWQISQLASPCRPLPFVPFIVQQIKLAACAQCEYLYYEGEEAALNGADSGGRGYRIGEASDVGGASSARSGGDSSNAGMLCQKAMAALMPTGLLYAGVPVW